MEEIRVYHSLWKNGLVVAMCFGFVAFGIKGLVEFPDKGSIFAWLCILFFGLGGLFMLWLMLKERITHTPYYIITDESIISNSGLKTIEIRFVYVERFFLTSAAKTDMIGIQYKKDVEFRKFEDAGNVGRAVCRFNESVAGSQECLPAYGLTIKPKVLCEILNERVKRSERR